MLLVANVACALALTAGALSPARVGAQGPTGPVKIDCCQATTEATKFCCDQCCFSGPICRSTEACNREVD